ncbi:integrase_H2C2 domain-containing protein [Nephila pilipes]|uniref:Integrase_H2C2 domain-containing protein n=1 Tax=Nephila pilipes TaxID=299642 RepID=A0A8X6NME3_NEPPI|nr:integrase_H2C2 domain-containing protein [Nephila pilipes]
MTAWILRFCRNVRVNSDKLTKELSYEEIQRAEEALIRLIQSEWPFDIREKYTQTIQFYEENKILKVRSRLILGEDPEDFVRPTVLPDHPIVRRLIDYIHQKLHHAGVQTTLSHLRERFWIPRGQLSSSEIFEDVPAIVKSAPDTSSSAKQCSTSNDQSFQSEDLPKEQEETLKKTRLGRQIVPPKRLDILFCIALSKLCPQYKRWEDNKQKWLFDVITEGKIPVNFFAETKRGFIGELLPQENMREEKTLVQLKQ